MCCDLEPSKLCLLVIEANNEENRLFPKRAILRPFYTGTIVKIAAILLFLFLLLEERNSHFVAISLLIDRADCFKK